MLKSNIFKKYKNSFFVETGCHLGNGIKNALGAGFKYIYSIELSPMFYNKCRNKFAKNKNVVLVLGDSSEKLFSVIENIKEPITFWLDGHYSGGNTARGKYESPLIQELEQIKRHPINNHIIIIDDMREWVDHNEFKHYDIYTALKEINKNYKFIREKGVVEKDILVAKV